MRRSARGLWTVVLPAACLLLALAGCATNRAALQPLTEADLRPDPGLSAATPPGPPPLYAPAPRGPMSARAVAYRNGLAYEDGGSCVLLSSPRNRVRLYPGTNSVSVDGQEMRLRGRVVREGGEVVVPAPAVAWIEGTLRRSRADHELALARAQGPQGPAVAPARVPPKAAPARAPAPRIPAAAPRSFASAEAGWVPSGVSERPWRWIVLHHSDDRSGNAAKYHAQHLAQGWENGLGYHFVIGNGTLSGDGQVEVGSRWVRQIQGAHTKTEDNCFNEQGIGICLVGDFENHGRPTAAQMQALVRLTQWLMDRYDIPLEGVKGHCDCKPTACPGKHFPWGEFRRRLAGAL